MAAFFLGWRQKPLREDLSVGGAIFERKIKTDHHSNPRVAMEILQGFSLRNQITFLFAFVFSIVHIEEVRFANVKIKSDQIRIISFSFSYIYQSFESGSVKLF